MKVYPYKLKFIDDVIFDGNVNILLDNKTVINTGNKLLQFENTISHITNTIKKLSERLSNIDNSNILNTRTINSLLNNNEHLDEICDIKKSINNLDNNLDLKIENNTLLISNLTKKYNSVKLDEKIKDLIDKMISEYNLSNKNLFFDLNIKINDMKKNITKLNKKNNDMENIIIKLNKKNDDMENTISKLFLENSKLKTNYNKSFDKIKNNFVTIRSYFKK